MKTNKIIRTLAGYNKGIFKALNQAYGFNWEKPLEIHELKTPFTLKKAVDTLTGDYFDKSNVRRLGYKVVIILHYPESFYGFHKNDNIVIDVIGTGAGDFNTSYSGCVEYPYSRAIDTFYRKGDFNEARKDIDIKAYIIAQASENIGRCHAWKKDYVENYTEREIKNAGDSFKQAYYNEAGERVYRDILRVDKSGYRVELKREELRNRAKEIKAERQKAAFVATDNSAKIEELKKRVEIAKEIIKERFEMANDSEELSQIRRNPLYDLEQAYYYFERLKKGEQEKSFKSIDTFNSYAQDVENYAKKIIAWNY